MWKLTQYKLEKLITRLLTSGIFLSVCIVLFGGVFFLTEQGNIPIKYHVFVGEPKDLTSILAVIMGAFKLQPAAIMQLGILILIATPVARVVLCVIYFFQKRDWLFFTLASIILTILFVSSLGLVI